MSDVVKVLGPWPFRGRVIWLTREQGGRASGPPTPSEDWNYAHTAFVPPHSTADGLASFALRGFTAAAWTSPAEGRWLTVENDNLQQACLDAGSAGLDQLCWQLAYTLRGYYRPELDVLRGRGLERRDSGLADRRRGPEDRRGDRPRE